MPTRRALFCLALALPALASGCGWTPLYASRETGPANAELRAIRVAPIAARIGQNLELGLRESLNPSGVPTPPRYVLNTTLQALLSDLGIQSQGLGTAGQVDAIATISLRDIATGKVLLNNTIHVNQPFDILANGYATVVNENDANNRLAEELKQEIVARLTMFMQRRIASASAKP